MTERFSLHVRLTDGFEFDLLDTYPHQWQAERAAENFAKDYSDPCGVGSRVYSISIIDEELKRAAREAA